MVITRRGYSCLMLFAERFKCQECGAWYVATWEQFPARAAFLFCPMPFAGAHVGMTWNDLRLILLTLGVVVAFYALFLAFGPLSPAGH